VWYAVGMSNSNTTPQPLTLGMDGMECNFCEKIVPWHELESHQCQGVLKKEEHMTPNDDEQVDWVGTYEEWLPMPPDHGYGREDYIDEAYCALCGIRTDFGPCPQGCPSEFV